MRRRRLLFGRPRRPHTSSRASGAFEREDGGGLNYYGAAVVGAETIGELAMSPAILDETWRVLARLEPDDYLEYVRQFVAEGRRRAGDGWRYADIVTALAAACDVVRPSSYLEIGVRRGRSMAVVASRAPHCRMIGIDLWTSDYAHMENPGPAHVEKELRECGFAGEMELISGNSHDVLPRLFAERPDLAFDLVTVDGDHSVLGAALDLRDVLPQLAVGGALVFDDIAHPAHPRLADVWRRVVARQRRYSTWEFDDVGYGVAVAVRRW